MGGDDRFGARPLAPVYSISNYRSEAWLRARATPTPSVLWARSLRRDEERVLEALRQGGSTRFAELIAAEDVQRWAESQRGTIGSAVVDLRLRWMPPVELIQVLHDKLGVPVLGVADPAFLRSRPRLVRQAFAAGLTDLVSVRDAEELRRALGVLQRLRTIAN